MENKKLLKFLLKDLSELEELVAEKGSQGFDVLELEFVHNRLKGAKRLIQLLSEREVGSPKSEVGSRITEVETVKEASEEEIQLPEKEVEKTPVKKPILVEKEEERVKDIKVEAKKEDSIKTDQKNTKVEETVAEVVKEDKAVKEHTEEGQVESVQLEPLKEEFQEPIESKVDEVELVDEEEKSNGTNTLGDSFTKEKSVNELVNPESNNLEQKISNRPVTNIKSSIGINDRFQYIRELFDGNADLFNKSVEELDSLVDIQEAVKYLQENFKWKKNETSLKFVNLVKRRFAND